MIARHKFASGVADSADAALILASDFNADHLVGWVMTNRTGGTLSAGDVVAIDPNNDDSVVLADTVSARRQYVVFVSALPSSSSHTPGTTINDGEQGVFLPVGAATVRVAGATARGNYLRKSASTKALEDTGVAVSAAPPGDALAVALRSSGGAGTLPAAFHGLPISPGGNLRSVQFFNASGTWNRPAGVRRVLVDMVGGGGGGGGVAATGASQPAAAGGGGGGGRVIKFLDVTNIASATITIGAGGTGGAAGANNGNAGGDTVWSDGTNTFTAGGGQGGNGAPADGAGDGGGGGSATGGDLNVPGAPGQGGVTDLTNAGSGGEGGDSAYGHGGKRRASTISVSGTNATGFGAGGGGAQNRASQGTGQPGGDGSGGLVIVWEYD